MRIARVSTHVLRAPLGDRRFYSSQAAFPGRNSLLVRIETDDGIVGWGEGGQYGPPSPVAAVVDDVLAGSLIGRSVTEPVRIWEELYSSSRDFGQKGTYVEALSAVDIALWDCWGKALGQPVHARLGGAFRSSVRAYATGCYYGEDYRDLPAALRAIEREAAGHADSGFDTLKMKVGLLTIADDAERVRVVRETIGGDRGLLVDANHTYNASAAIRMGRVLETYACGWFEEPVVPEDRAGYREVRRVLDVAVAGGEAEFTRFGFRDLLAEGCVDIAQPDLCAAGGFSEFQKILALAPAFGVLVVPHVWGSGVALAAALQAVSVVPPSPYTHEPVPLQNEPAVEFDRSPNPLRDELLAGAFTLEDGCLRPPDGPGLGVTVDEARLRRFEAAR